MDYIMPGVFTQPGSLRDKRRSCHPLLGLVHGGERSQQARRIDADRIDPEPGEKLRDFRIVGRRLATNSDLATIAFGAGDREPQHLENARVALVEIKCDDFGIAIDA